MLKIYGLHTPMFLKVLWAAEELGVNYQHIPVDLIKGETRTPEHLIRHPFGKVPAIEHEGKFLFESNAILRYMANMSKGKLYPNEVYEKALVDQWMDYFSLQAGRWTTMCWFQTVIAPKYFNEQPDHKLLAEVQTWLDEQMPIVDKLLGTKKYICGNDFSIADINAFCLMAGWKDAGLNFAQYTNFTRWMDEVKSRPNLQKLKQHWPSENI